MILRSFIVFILCIFSVNSAFAASSRAKCSFDTIGETSPYIMQEMTKVYSDDSLNSEGWRVGYQLNSNPNVRLYLGHKTTPQVSNFEMIDYLQFLGSSVESIERDLSPNGTKISRILNVELAPYSISLNASSNSDGKIYNSEYFHFQVGNACALITLLRTPQDSINSSYYVSLKNEVETLKSYSYTLLGPVALKPTKFIPEGYVAIGFGLIFPAFLLLILLSFLIRIDIYGNARFAPQQKLLMILFPVLSYLYLSMMYGMNMLNNNEFIGTEIVIYFVLVTIALLYWGIVGLKSYLPISILSISFLITLLYLSMGWYLFPLYAFISMIVSLLALIIVLIMTHMSELDAMENKGRYSKDRSHYKMD